MAGLNSVVSESVPIKFNCNSKVAVGLIINCT
jgi:hypothetical protein